MNNWYTMYMPTLMHCPYPHCLTVYIPTLSQLFMSKYFTITVTLNLLTDATTVFVAKCSLSVLFVAIEILVSNGRSSLLCDGICEWW